VTYAHNTNRRFGQKNSRIIAREVNNEWEHLFHTFLGDLDEKMTLAGYKRE